MFDGRWGLHRLLLLMTPSLAGCGSATTGGAKLANDAGPGGSRFHVQNDGGIDGSLAEGDASPEGSTAGVASSDDFAFDTHGNFGADGTLYVAMRDSPDLILMPHSAPCVPGGATLMREGLRGIAQHYARALGVPIVMVNKVHGRSRSPLPGVPLLRLQFDFPGLSSICDSDGNVLASLGDLEGVAVGDVTLDPARKLRPAAPSGFYWARPPRRFPRVLGAFFVALERLGIRAYEGSASRRVAARNVGLAGSEG